MSFTRTEGLGLEQLSDIICYLAFTQNIFTYSLAISSVQNFE